MRLFYSSDFTGHWPVGTAAVVVANDEEEAAALLSSRLLEHGLSFDGRLTEIDATKPMALVLLDGNY
jgi:hypothetical protein